MGVYEFHITVQDYPTVVHAVDFEKYCRETLSTSYFTPARLLGSPTPIPFKCNLIQLHSGKYPMQLMLAAKRGFDDDAAAMIWAAALATRVVKDGWTVMRTKVETALKPGKAEYFEAHWKFIIPDVDLFFLNKFLRDNPGYLSSRNHFQDNVYYLSRRSYQPDHKVAKKLFEACNQEIRLKLPVLLKSYHYERVVFDSFPSLDEGWID